jgi:hypothetical protein
MVLYDKSLNVAVYGAEAAVQSVRRRLLVGLSRAASILWALKLEACCQSRAKICYLALDQTEAFLDLFSCVEGKHIFLSERPFG